MHRRLLLQSTLATVLMPSAASTEPTPAYRAPERLVRRNRLRSLADPAVTIRVPRAARYLGAARWPLYDVADCEVHVFAEATPSKLVKRLYWVQFEQFLPQHPGQEYDFTRPVFIRETRWGANWFRRARFGPTNEPPAVGSDLERVTDLIVKAGLTLPANIVNVKLGRLLDDPSNTGLGRKELLLFYWEDMADLGVALADLITDDQTNARWASIESGLVERAAKSFDIQF